MFPLQLFGSLALGVILIATLFAPDSGFLTATLIVTGKLLLICAAMGLVWMVGLPAHELKGVLKPLTTLLPGTAAFLLIFTALGVALRMTLAFLVRGN